MASEYFLHEVNKSGRAVDVTMDLYRDWARNFDKDHKIWKSIVPQTAAKTLMEFYPEQRDRISILDCGAGTGLVAEELVRCGFTNIDAVDGSKEMLQEAAKKNIYGRQICDFLGTNRLPVDDDSYDCIVCIGTISPSHANEECFPEMIRIVKPGGMIYISTRHVNILNDPHLNVHLEPAMQNLHDEGQWKWVVRKIVPKYCSNYDGFVAVFEVL